MARSNQDADFSGVVIGKLVDVTRRGEALVDFPGNPGAGPRSALTLARLEPAHLGREVALSFEGADPTRPVVLGVVQHPELFGTRPEVDANGRLSASVDDERIVIDATREIILRCGHSSITLTRDGKVRIRGRDLLTRSSGGNRIKGASVQIN
jgi:hypothetical protein